MGGTPRDQPVGAAPGPMGPGAAGAAATGSVAATPATSAAATGPMAGRRTATASSVAGATRPAAAGPVGPAAARAAAADACRTAAGPVATACRTTAGSVAGRRTASRKVSGGASNLRASGRRRRTAAVGTAGPVAASAGGARPERVVIRAAVGMGGPRCDRGLRLPGRCPVHARGPHRPLLGHPGPGFPGRASCCSSRTSSRCSSWASSPTSRRG